MIRRFLDLSTVHITEETAEWISDYCPHCHPIDDTGWFIWANPVPPEEMPQDLVQVLKHARSLDCDYVLLDQDAEVIDELPEYDW